MLNFILDEVEFIGIPIVCASGFNDGTYENRNGVNLNRTFPNNSGEVASQTETLLVQQEFEKHLDMDFFIDFHNINSTVRKEKIGYTITSNTLFGNTMNLMYKSIGNAWQKENPTFPQDRNYKWAHNALGRSDTAENFANNVHNINGGLVELTNELEWVAGGKFGEPTVRMGVEFLVNSLIGLIRTKV